MKLHASLIRFVICGCLASCLGLQCNLFTPEMPPPTTGDEPAPEPPAPSFNIDGNWRHAASGTLRETCITIANSRITVMDDGCSGNLLPLVSTPPAQAQGDTGIFRIFASFSDSPTSFTNGGIYTYELMLGAGDTLQGSCSLRMEPNGPILTGDVVLVRN